MGCTLINRALEGEFLRLSQSFSVLTLTGPRQSGKTTLCKKLFPHFAYVNLEDARTRQAVQTDNFAFLQQFERGVIIDEAYHIPGLFSAIQVLVDENPHRRFILTGSSNFSLLENITQSLAGRAAILTLLPLSLCEIKEQIASTDTNTILVNGGYPEVWNGSKAATDVYRNYYNTYIERDVRQLLNVNNISHFQSFMRLCAGRVGSEFNASMLANEIGVSVKTIQNWLNTLEASYVLFSLPPFFRNIGKRLIKNRKIYFYDTGLATYLLNIESPEMLANHPVRGGLFENLAVVEFVKNRYNSGKEPNLFFYRDNLQEVDIVQEQGFDELYAYEIKSAQSYHSDFNKGLDYFRKLFGQAVKSTQVIYDGTLELASPKNGYVNFRNLFIEL